MSKDPELTIQFAQIAFDQVCPEVDDDPDRRTLERIIAFREKRQDERHAFQDAVQKILESITVPKDPAPGFIASELMNAYKASFVP